MLTTFSYVGDISFPAYYAGIYKGDAYGIYANATTVFGYINNMTYSYRGISPGWIHLAMVYDMNTVRIYVNASEVFSTSYTQPIQTTDARFIIGNSFSGKIDEVALYGQALTQSQIESHYLYPGDLS
jgi:hypothetical protein